MNRDDPEKRREERTGDGIDLMRSDMEWKGVAAHRGESAVIRHDSELKCIDEERNETEVRCRETLRDGVDLS